MELNIPLTEQNMKQLIRQLRCKRCGTCCNLVDKIALLKHDIEPMADALGISKHQFKDRYTFTRDGRRFLSANPCVFYHGGCTIYKARPQVCRQFPFNQSYVKEGKNYIGIVECPAGLEILKEFGVKV